MEYDYLKGVQKPNNLRSMVLSEYLAISKMAKRKTDINYNTHEKLVADLNALADIYEKRITELEKI